MKRIILIGMTLTISGCAKKFTDDQAKAIVKKCVERRYCDGNIVNIETLDVAKRDETVSGLRRLPVGWKLNGSVDFLGKTTLGHKKFESCSNSFTASVVLVEHNETRISDDPIAFVQIDHVDATTGQIVHPDSVSGGFTLRPERKGCYYFLVSGKSAEK